MRSDLDRRLPAGRIAGFQPAGSRRSEGYGVIAAILLAFNLLQFWHDTNSHAANARGAQAFERKKYAESAAAFTKQNAISPSPAASFNLGTSQIAAGNREQGSATISKALNDPQVRADAFFNRGNSALAAKAYDYAIHDFSEALKANPRDAAAKRNLEIALAQQRAMHKQPGGSQPDKQGSQQQPKKQPQAEPDRGANKGDANAEALLRSVQQQEKEELSRMHKGRGEKLHVGW